VALCILNVDNWKHCNGQPNTVQIHSNSLSGYVSDTRYHDDTTGSKHYQ